MIPSITTAVAKTLHGKLLAACNVTYEIVGAGRVHSNSCWFEAAGFYEPPIGVVGGELAENAAMVGRIEEGVVIAFRGTLSPDDSSKTFAERLLDWTHDLDALLIDWRGITGKIHQGFAKAFDTVQAQIDPLIPAGTENLFFVGHSKGGALARLAALDNFKLLGRPVKVVTFGAPRCGNIAFSTGYASTPIQDTRYEAFGDIVPHVPFKETLAHLVGQAIGRDIPAFDYEAVGKVQLVNALGHIKKGTRLQRLAAMADLAALLATKNFSGIRQAHGIDIGSLYAAAVAPEVINNRKG